MGLFGGSKSYSGSAQKWARPFAQQGAQSVQSVFNASQPGLQKLTDTVQGTVPGLSSMFSSWQPQTEQSRGYYSDVLSGKYLDPSNNPGLQSVLDRMKRDVTGSVQSEAAKFGRYGPSAAYTDVLSRNLAEQEGAILTNEYGRERAAMDSAAGAVPQITASQLQQLLQAAGVGAELPYAGTNAMASGLSALFSGGTQKQGSGLSGLLSSAAKVGGTALMASDRRLKSNIVKIGEEADGLGVYEYDIFGERTRGVMADEVEKLRPWALGPEIAGYKTVRYDEL